jgi:hypothetical protein
MGTLLFFILFVKRARCLISEGKKEKGIMFKNYAAIAAERNKNHAAYAAVDK